MNALADELLLLLLLLLPAAMLLADHTFAYDRKTLETSSRNI